MKLCLFLFISGISSLLSEKLPPQGPEKDSHSPYNFSFLNGNLFIKNKFNVEVGSMYINHYYGGYGLTPHPFLPQTKPSTEASILKSSSIGRETSTKEPRLGNAVYRDCCEAKYLIKPDTFIFHANITLNGPTAFQVVCDEYDVIIGHLGNHSSFKAFNSTWTEFVNGFGEIRGAHPDVYLFDSEDVYWAGLDTIHKLSKYGYNQILYGSSHCKNESSKYCHGGGGLSDVKISSHEEDFQITSTSAQFGTSPTLKFSTHDHDNDKDEDRNCARQEGFAWWHDTCEHTKEEEDLQSTYGTRLFPYWLRNKEINGGAHEIKAFEIVFETNQKCIDGKVG